VYRGGGALKNRRMARFAMSMAFLSLAGVVVLRMGTIMSTLVQITLDPITIFDAEFFYTMSRISYQATLGAGEAAKGVLDWQLTIASGLLFLSYLAAMAGLIGGSARSLGGNSLRVRRAAALPTTAIIMAVVSLLLLAWASATAPTAVRDSWGIDDMSVSLGWGLLVGVVLSIGALASALAYMKGLGLEFVREALAFWKKQEVSEEDLEEEGIPQPMLDQALAEDARAMGELPPPEPEVKVPTPPLRERLLLKDARRNQIIIAVVIIVLIIIIAVLWTGGPGGNGGNGGEEPIVIADLPTFSEDHVLSEYLNEGDVLSYNTLSTILQGDPETTVYFVDQVSLRLAWRDEPDAGILWTNAPDTFRSRLEDNQGIHSPAESETNPQGGEGMISIDWISQDTWFAVGNTDLVDWGDQQVLTDSDVAARLVLVNAGNQATLGGRTQTDDGNTFTLTVTVSGHVYNQDSDGQ
ncbi:MAG: hypothetical protein KAJ35_10275, partial [Thermoplasmata archaeon]|nr:hypothetical protein [Thermoplasmata archaeon]